MEGRNSRLFPSPMKQLRLMQKTNPDEPWVCIDRNFPPKLSRFENSVPSRLTSLALHQLRTEPHSSLIGLVPHRVVAESSKLTVATSRTARRCRLFAAEAPCVLNRVPTSQQNAIGATLSRGLWKLSTKRIAQF